MSLHPQAPLSASDETRRVARAAFPRGTPCLRIADELGPIWRDEQFVTLFPRRGQPAEAPGRLALASVPQFVGNLSDRQAADAVRGGIDRKYALGLSLTDPGFDHTVPGEFRSRLIGGNVGRLLLDTLLLVLRDRELIKARGRQRTDSTHVLAAVRGLNRLERVGETLRAALNDLAVVAPEWLRALAPVEWHDRHDRRVENHRLPKTGAARLELAATVGADGRRLLAAIDAAVGQPWLAQLPAVEVLRQVWEAQYIEEEGILRWRTVAEMPAAAEQISSPYDPEARHGTRREVSWVGYKVHFTETCDPDAPPLITNAETTPATTPDDNMLAAVHQSLRESGLLPAGHLVDKGYTGAHALVDSKQRHGVTIVGPVADDPSWQARSGDGLAKAQFLVDWDHRVVTCPAGKQGISWLPNTWPGNGVVFEARFSRKDCTPCSLRSRCTRAKNEPRIIGLQAREHHEALRDARRHQATEAFPQDHAARAGVEATHAQAIGRCGLRRCRHAGLAKTTLRHVITAAAVNLVRIAEWFAGTPIAETRCSRFAALPSAA